MSKISIALCTYNGAKFLPEQLESFLTQTRLPDELIACDDRSQDETVRIIENFARLAPFPVRLFVNERNLGSTKNFEKAISSCSGDLIFLSDQDDVWLPAKIERMEKEFEANANVGMVFSDAEIVGENLESTNCNLWSFTFAKKRRNQAQTDGFFDVVLSQNIVTGATMAFRASFREIFTPIPDGIPNLIHDGWISLLIANEAEVVSLEEPLIKYRQHRAQQLGINYEAALTRDFSRRITYYQAAIEVYADELERLRQMEEIFAVYPQFIKRRAAVSFVDLTEEKAANIAHLKARIALTPNRMRRFSPIIKEVLTGRYHRFSKGFLSAIKDLLEKW